MPEVGDAKLSGARITLVIGTRPEAIKLAPVAHALAARGAAPSLILTGQHPGLVLGEHGLGGYIATRLACPGEDDPRAHARTVATAVAGLLLADAPDLLVVQGDTSSALGGALAAVQAGVPIAHVEAGLRSFDPAMPWPEEDNRVAIDAFADLLFAPTETSAANLRGEGVGGAIHVTGNSGVDALLATIGSAASAPPARAERGATDSRHLPPPRELGRRPDLGRARPDRDCPIDPRADRLRPPSQSSGSRIDASAAGRRARYPPRRAAMVIAR